MIGKASHPLTVKERTVEGHVLTPEILKTGITMDPYGEAVTVVLSSMDAKRNWNQTIPSHPQFSYTRWFLFGMYECGACHKGALALSRPPRY